jgi:3',5'-cyclic-AMP phosphodiesterase
MFVIAHLSDTHFDGGRRNTDRAARVIAYLDGLAGRVDAVLVTGDIADHGLPAEYEQASRILSLPYPVLHCPGNHDVRRTYRAGLLGQPGDAPINDDAPINQVHRVGAVVFAMCDSTIPGRDDGFLADGTIAWLDGVLAGTAEDAPVFVGFHHPPADLHIPFIDNIRQRGEQRLADLVRRHRQVVAVLCGHAHTAAASTFAGRPLLVAPGVASTLTLPWERGDVVDYDLPPAVAFHILDQDGRLTTHYRVIP